MYKQLTPAYALVKAAWVSRIKQKPTSLVKSTNKHSYGIAWCGANFVISLHNFKHPKVGMPVFVCQLNRVLLSCTEHNHNPFELAIHHF